MPKSNKHSSKKRTKPGSVADRLRTSSKPTATSLVRSENPSLRFSGRLGESWGGWPDSNQFNGVVFKDTMFVRVTDRLGHATGELRPIAYPNHAFALHGNTSPHEVLQSCELMDPRQTPAQQAATALQMLLTHGMLIEAARWAIEQIKLKAGGENVQGITKQDPLSHEP